MGSFYTNITLRTDNFDQVRRELVAGGRHAFLSPAHAGAVVVFDQACEDQNPEELKRLASLLTQRLSCAGLAVLIHDDDVLTYELYDRGALKDEYNSAPEYFDGGDGPPSGGNAEELCQAFGRAGVEDEIEAILKRTHDADDAFTFETERHAELVRVLGLHEAAVGTGYTYLDAGEAPSGTAISAFLRIG